MKQPTLRAAAMATAFTSVLSTVVTTMLATVLSTVLAMALATMTATATAAPPADAADPAPQLLDVKVTQVEVKGVPGIRVESADGEVLVEPNGQPIFSATACKIDWKLLPQPGGFDLLLTVYNPTAQTQPRPDVMLRGVRVAEKFSYLDGRDLGHLRQETRPRGERIFHCAWDYPNDLYAPAGMMRNDRFAVGASLIYDVMNSRHSVAAVMYTEGGAYFGTSGVGFSLNVRTPNWSQPVGRPGLEPETSDSYRVAYRFSKPDRWLDTLAPYREHFRKTWGGVKYHADRRPVYGETMALVQNQNDDNPRGYPPKQRYDRLGFKPLVEMYQTRAVANGYRRVMIWCASGLYRHGSNYPCEFMTQWPEKLVATAGELDRLRDAGVTVGHWWGRAGQVSGGWDTARMWVRDMGVPADVQTGLDELALAKKRGAVEIGLDASTAMPLWHRIEWLRTIQKNFPEMRYITEASDCDIMHTLAPTFMTFDRQGEPPVLADYLNPGHESWIMLRWQLVNQANFDKIVGWGCVPVTMSVPVTHDASKFASPKQPGR